MITLINALKLRPITFFKINVDNNYIITLSLERNPELKSSENLGGALGQVDTGDHHNDGHSIISKLPTQ
jgi:hypothetical protein